jgi:phage head maturation protease
MKSKTLQQKMATHFGVKTVEGSSSIKMVDAEKRTVEFVANTYFFIDSDQDMLISGCAAKSINDRGPKSNATAKIKHQSDHVLNTKNVVGRFDLIDERNIDGMDVLYCESHIPSTAKGNDDLINYQEGLYDNHSIGFRYKQIVKAVLNSTNEMERKAWDEFYPLALNPEKADEEGFFWVVKEIELFEISVVSYGANKLTANLTGKSKDDNEKIKSNLIERLDELNGQLKSLSESKNQRGLITMEILQMKQIITDLKLIEPSKKDTPSKEPSNNDTHEGKSKTINPITNLSKNYKK